MSLNRYNPKRDANEPAIRARFATNGWHTEQRSSSGGWDLDAYPPNQDRFHLYWSTCVHVDVKMPGKKATKAQVKKWTSLSEKGIPVYVASTEADVDAIVGGTATPWAPEMLGRLRPALHPPTKPVKRSVMALCDGGCGKRLWTKAKGIVKKAVLCDDCALPPRSTPVDATTTSLGAEVMREMMKPPGEEDYSAAIARSLRAAEQAAETFAPSDQCSVPSCLHAAPCPKHSLSVLGRP